MLNLLVLWRFRQRISFYLSTILLGLACSVFAHAIQLTPFTGTQLLDQSTQDTEYPLALGAMKNVNGQWLSEPTLLLNGTLNRSVYELPKSRPVKEVVAHYQQQLQRAGATPLFVCNGHTCGSSASWANQQLGDRRLYGLDQYQVYFAYRVQQGEHSAVVVMYFVTRGNQRSYALVDVLSTQESVNQLPTPITLRTLLESGQRLELPLELAPGSPVASEYAALVVRALALAPTLKVVIVAADYRQGSLEQNLSSSAELVAQVKQQLVNAGVAASRLQVESIGSLAPPPEGKVAVWLFSRR